MRLTRMMVMACALALCGAATVRAASTIPSDVFKLDLFDNNEDKGPDARLRITNPGLNSDATPAGDLCAMIYVFTWDEQMAECCGCRTTPNGLLNLSVKDDLTNNSVTGERPEMGVIKVVSGAIQTAPNPFNPFGPPIVFCDPTNVTPKQTLRQWASHVDRDDYGTYSGFDLSTSPSVDSPLGMAEFSDLQSDCAEIQEHGSGKGVCECACKLFGAHCTNNNQCCSLSCNLGNYTCNQ
jgi:hypothetical protein